ncbi:hypothetical protein ACRZ5O_21215 [Pseudomonas protegens]|uniref:hypothetical protein n=1 Tax=Pseudomonas protegens TaxID=380021 RepID=UPI003FD8A8AC
MIRYLIAALVACLFLIYGGWQRIQAQAVALDAATARNACAEQKDEIRLAAANELADRRALLIKQAQELEAKRAAQ